MLAASAVVLLCLCFNIPPMAKDILRRGHSLVSSDILEEDAVIVEWACFGSNRDGQDSLFLFPYMYYYYLLFLSLDIGDSPD